MPSHEKPTNRFFHEVFVLATAAILSVGLVLVWLIQFVLPGGASLPTHRAILGSTLAQTCLPWQIMDSPNPSTQHNELYDLAIISANDIWAVGYSDVYNYVAHTLTMHWDGTAWTAIPSPNPEQNNYLFGVSAVSPNDIWAVGKVNPMGPERTLAMHWDGTEWSVVPTPDPTIVGDEILIRVAAISENDAWAVGWYYGPDSVALTLTTHWDGQTWSVVSSPSPGGKSYNTVLYGVSALVSNDVWAAGLYGDHSLVLHWDGTEWSVSPTPDPAPDYGYGLYAIYAIATDDVWAVGVHGPPSGPTPATLTMHWDGQAWSVIPSPNFDSQVNYLFGVTGIASGEAWAVGWTNIDSLVLHWDGVQWSRQDSENVGGYENYLRGVEALNDHDVWAVGSCEGCYGSGINFRTLVEHYNGSCPSSTPTPTPTITTTSSPVPSTTPTSTSTPSNTPIITSTPLSTPTTTPILTATLPPSATGQPSSTPLSTSTGTPTVPPSTQTTTSTTTPSPPTSTSTSTNTSTSATATETPTACTLSFTDVPSDSTFYPYIHCLACLGIISGYADGAFRPGEQVSRGQLAKIVSNSAGFHEPPGAQMFEDVPPLSTFYDYIGRLAGRGYISGYPCGGDGEPCGPSSLSYFRPNSNATRGQISKVVSNAAGFQEPPGTQLFEDVPPGSTFYDYVQRLASRGVIAGYPCGGEGEPCGPTSLPYFRPSNSATRGQTTKIDAGTFFPDCEP